MLGFSTMNILKCLNINSKSLSGARTIHLTAYFEAKRKGYREQARKKKVKVEVQKIGFIPHNLRNKDKLNLLKANKHVDDSWKAIPKDNVYVGRYYRWTLYSIEEAIQCHRETHHPTMYNVPNALLNVDVELNMKGEKATRFVDNFNRMAMVPYKFDHGEERKILVFTKDNDSLLEARKAGASLVGGVELIKDVQNGDLKLTDYQFIIAHPNILPELVSLRGLLKRKFPNPKNGTLTASLGEVITKFSNGISYKAVKDEHQQDFGIITTCVGTLDMDIQYLKENLISLLKDVNSVRPKREGTFITRVLLKSFPSGEQLKIDPFVYIPQEYQKTAGKSLKESKFDNNNIEDEEPIEVKN